MVTETVRCSRCDKWFQREKLEAQKLVKTGKVEEDLCPECDEEVKQKE